MIDRQMELKRRYHRKKKMHKWKAKLETATGEARTLILAKIKRLTPSWTEASLKSAVAAPAKPKAEAKAPKEPKEPKKKAPPKPKAEKK